MNYIKKEWKKLGSMSLVGVGSFLILEHIYTYGGIELVDILGHEWFGILLIITGLICANRKVSKEKWLKEAKAKLNYIFKSK